MLTWIGVSRDVTWSTFLGVVGRAAVGAVVLVGVGYLLSIPTPMDIGPVVLDRVADLHDERLLWAVQRVSGLGNVWVVGAAAAAVAAALQLRGSPLAGEVRLLLIGTYGGALVITAPLKLLTSRARPSGALVGTLSSAYPSGHALRTAAVYGLLIWLLHRHVRAALTRTLAVTTVAVVMAAIAAARVVLWVHWPSDVLVGVMLGGTWLAILLHVTRRVRSGAGGEARLAV